jgi:tRNA nucleotidyltransferase (CCA-adding enzyme)
MTPRAQRREANPEAAARAALAAHAWPEGLDAVLARIAAGGHRAYLVGGTVRDVLLGRRGGTVFDVATDLLPDEVMARFARVEPIGLKHGTVLVLEGGIRLEVTTFRREGAYRDARHPEHVSFTRDPLEDLARRDLTVNAIAWDPRRQELLDLHGGIIDLARGVLRAVGDPIERFREDALRPLRVARLAAALEMTLAPETRAAMASAVERARLVAVERVRDELEKLMQAPRPSLGLELLREAGLLELWMPELTRGYGVPQNRWHAWDVYDHGIRAADAAPADKPVVRWAALLHDIGKPDTRVERSGEGTFYNHQFVGAELADRLLARLKFPLETRARIVHLVREHMFDYQPGWGDAALRRWLRRVGVDAVADLFDLRIADVMAKGREEEYHPGHLEEMRARIERLLAESRALRVSDLAVNGHDVMRVLGMPPGPRVRETLEALLEEVLDRPSRNTREHLLQRLERERDRGADADHRAPRDGAPGA